MRLNPNLVPIASLAVTVGVFAACGPSTPAPQATPAPSARPITPTPTQTPLPTDTTVPAPGGGGGRGGRGNAGGGGAAAGAPNPQPYGRVITADARTRDGMFKVHRIGERLLFEIPRRELNKDELLVSEIARTTLGAGYGSQPAGQHVLRWERRDNRVLLRSVSYGVIASDTTNPVRGAVEAANVMPIIAAFNVESYGPDSAPVVDVTRLFTQVPPELNPTNITGTLDATRSFLDRALAFPDNINVESTLTFGPTGRGGGGATPDVPTGGRGGRGATPPSQTVVMSYSIHKLPEVPMKPRLCDNRVGFFSTTTTDYSRPDQRVQTQCFITRYRLEKKDPTAAISEPVKPIVYYIDPNTPKKWVPWLKKAIEDWQPAFEAAGFKNAIVAREAPMDGEWSAQDARYSVVDWLPSTTENASGPHVSDPRSGEILNAHIQFYHNVQSLARTWYFTQAGAVDARARQFPIPDSLMGRLLEYVLAHEVGHTIGYQHNMKASAMYPLDSIRSASFVHRMGHTPTLMDYARFNYVAQPEDKIAFEDLIPRIGPYDIWATHWGYAPIPQAKTPEDERPILDQWAREQDQKPWLRFSTAGAAGSDPQDETEAVGDIDPVRATELGVKNLRVVMGYVSSATVKPLENFDELGLLYQAVIGQWRTEMGHVVNLVGGAYSQDKYGSQPGARFTPVPKARQKQAVQFLIDNALKTPTFLIDTAIDRRLEPSGEVRRIEAAQAGVVTGLMNDAKLTRLIEWEALSGGSPDTYSAQELLSDVRHGVFSELSQPAPKIDVYRRELQRSWVDQAIRRVRPPVAAPATPGTPAPGGGRGGGGAAPPSGDIKALFRGELQDAEKDISAAIPKAADRMTRLHLETLRAEIRDALAGKGTTADEGGL
jgi:hypothetical protein